MHASSSSVRPACSPLTGDACTWPLALSMKMYMPSDFSLDLSASPPACAPRHGSSPSKRHLTSGVRRTGTPRAASTGANFA